MNATLKIKGIKGDKGDAGESIQGIQGIQGEIGPKGDKGDKGESIVGPKGDKGDRGLDGLDGISPILDYEKIAKKLPKEDITPKIISEIKKLNKDTESKVVLELKDLRGGNEIIKEVTNIGKFAQTGQQYDIDGVYTASGNRVNFIPGENTTITGSPSSNGIDITISSTGGGGGSQNLQQVTDEGATTTVESTFSGGILTPQIKANTSAGIDFKSNSDTDIGRMGAGGGSNVSWYGNHNFSTATQDTIAGFLGTGKTLSSLPTATYPSLPELSYVKGVTSAIQTQLNGKVTGATDSTLSLTGTTLGLNLGNANTWTGQQTFKSSAVGTPSTIIQAIASQTADLFQLKTSAGSVRMGFSDAKSQLFLGDTSGDSNQGLIYMVDATHSFKPGIKMIKYTWGSGLDIALSTASPIILASGGSTFTDYTTTDTGTYFANSFTRGASFVVRNDNDSYGTQGFYARAFNNNSAPSVSGATKRAVVYGVAGTAENNATGNGGAGLRSFSASANIDGVRIDYLSGQTAPLIRARLVNSENDVSQTVATDYFRVESSGSIWNRLTTKQQQWEYDASNYANITVGSTGGVTFNAVGSGASFTFSDKVIVNDIVRLKGYTVATLPAGTQGDTAYVTDASAPTYLTTVTGGGAVVCPVFYDGTNWVAH